MPSFVYFLLFTLFFTLRHLGARPISHSLRKPQLKPKDSTFDHQCNETCGSFQVPYPFYVKNASRGWSKSPFLDSFQLSCLNSTFLFLNIDSQNYRVVEFFSDGVLVDFPGFSNSCRPYNDLNSFGFVGNECFGISSDNVLGLYDCEDSFLCKANCEVNDLPGCDRNRGGIGNGPACCYPLSDHSVWHVGDGFDVFSKYECRGFSSWVVPRGMSLGKRGVKLEWALPINYSKDACGVNAHTVNATTVRHGKRCVCDDGFVGDGYANGTGCLKSCFNDGKEKFNEACEPTREAKRKTIILTAVLLSVFVAACLVSLLCMVKRSVESTGYGSEQQPPLHSTLSFGKSCNTRLFTFNELDEATKGFNEGQKLMDGSSGSVFTGTLKDGSHIAVQKVHCENERDLIQVLSQIEHLSSILHCHLAHILGCCIDTGYMPMVVYEFPENRSLQDHLHLGKEDKIGLDWYKRLSIATQTASILAFLQHEISPPVFHHDLNTSSIFLDEEYNVKVACFGLSGNSNLYRSDVYDMGIVLLEIISGSKLTDVTMILQKIRDSKLKEMIDPLLYNHEQPPPRKEQIEVVADLATRCLIFGGSAKLSMVDVARELVHITKENIDGGSRRRPALEETFSNSSLLQMISMSPDSIYVP